MSGIRPFIQPERVPGAGPSALCGRPEVVGFGIDGQCRRVQRVRGGGLGDQARCLRRLLRRDHPAGGGAAARRRGRRTGGPDAGRGFGPRLCGRPGGLPWTRRWWEWTSPRPWSRPPASAIRRSSSGMATRRLSRSRMARSMPWSATSSCITWATPSRPPANSLASSPPVAGLRSRPGTSRAGRAFWACSSMRWPRRARVRRATSPPARPSFASQRTRSSSGC